jgi:N-acetylmuramoyl-L-alanine amidase
LFAFCPPGEAGTAALYRGNTALGDVAVLDGGRDRVVSVADAGALLGLRAEVVGEELVLSRGDDRLRVVLNATAAWNNARIVPLYSASFTQEGRWWLDVPSVLTLLQPFAGREREDRLRMEERAAASGSPADGAPDATVASATTPSAVSLQAPSVTAPPAASLQALPSAGPGELRALRWSVSREKIRAVADCSEGTNPELKLVSGKMSMTFAGAADDLPGVPSPYENVQVELTRGRDVTLFFTASGVRVEKLVLDKPRRIVLDFVFNTPTEIKAAGVSAAAREDAPRAGARKGGRRLVVLDPGHGGNDPGAVGNGLREKDINLSVGLKMEKALQSKGFDVKMTRRTDVYLKLEERTAIANEAGADMFVSVHVNALPPGKNSAGFEIYLMALPTDKDALALAKIENREYIEDKGGNAASDRRTELLLKILGDMQQNNKIDESTAVAEYLFKEGNRGGLPMKRVAQAPFFVLRGAAMPAVLLELGFITNASEAKLLAHPDYQQKIADSMTAGIQGYSDFK